MTLGSILTLLTISNGMHVSLEIVMSLMLGRLAQLLFFTI